MDWFFRLRSSLHCDVGGQIRWARSEYEFDLIAQALRFLDFNSDCFNAEIFACMDVSNGGFTRSDLLDMPFDEYEKIIEHTIDLQKRIKESLSVRNDRS